MANQKINFNLTEIENQVMETFWRAGEPLSAQEVNQLSPDKIWASASVHLFLRNLIDKGVLEVTGFKNTGRNYGRTFYPVMSKEEFLLHTIINPWDKEGILKIFNLLLQEITDLEELDALHDEINAAIKGKNI